MKALLLLLLLLVLASKARAQAARPGAISGLTADSLTGQPLAYVTVALKSKARIIAGTTADGAGAFRLPDLPLGDYTLELSFIGYQTKIIPVSLTLPNPSLQLSTIRLSPQAKVLGAVDVSGQRALVEDKGDRLVYHAEKDISNAGGTAADVLRKVPSLTVDLEGNVQMRGNSNMKVLINGRPSAMMSRNLADALRQMPANIIRSVEVITSPGAKYDAEGSAGIINIITKKGLQGFNGSANATVGNFNRGLGGSLQYKKKKIGFSLQANGHQYRQQWEQDFKRTSLHNGLPVNALNQHNEADNTGIGGNGEMSLDFDPDSTSHLNFSANVWGGNFPSNSTLYNRLTDHAGWELAAFRNESRYHNPYGNGQLDLGYTKTLKRKNQEFSLLGQFSRMPDNYFYQTNTYSHTDVLTFRQNSTNYSRNKEYTVQTDYTHPFTWQGRRDTTSIKLEAGLKVIRRDIGSEYEVEEAAGSAGVLQANPFLSNAFTYLQRVYAAYTSARLETSKKWQLNLGARLEQTHIEGYFLNAVTTRSVLRDRYRNLIPSITLSKQLKDQTLKAAYTRRLQRPLVWYLNPWVYRSDTLSQTTGNPYLDPEQNHAAELGYNLHTKKGLSVNSTLYWNYTDNAIEYLATVTPAGVSVSSPDNIGRRQTYGLNLNLSGQANKNWQVSGAGSLRYVELSSPRLHQKNQGWVWNINFNSTYKLARNYSVQANGGINSGWIRLQERGSAFSWHGLAIKKEFLEKKASLNLNLSSPLARGVWQHNHRLGPTFVSDARSRFVQRSARLTFEWRFGQMAAGGGRQAKKIINDDKGDR